MRFFLKEAKLKTMYNSAGKECLHVQLDPGKAECMIVTKKALQMSCRAL